jgi:hypothetical protein
VKTSDGGEPDGDLREIEFKKNNYGPISANIVVRYQNGLFLPVEGTTLDVVARRAQARSVFLTILSRFNSENRNVSANSGISFAPPKFAVEREATMLRLTKEELGTAMRDLMADRRVIQVNYGKPSQPRYRLEVNPNPDDPNSEPM